MPAAGRCGGKLKLGLHLEPAERFEDRRGHRQEQETGKDEQGERSYYG